jgi:hypothetical protein
MILTKSIRAGTVAVALLFASAALAEPDATPAPENAEESMTLKGGDEGTVLGDLTIRGEDRIRIEFERPTLSLDLEPREAAGLDWGDPTDVLQRSGIDIVGPLPIESIDDVCPFLARPWLQQFRSGGVARFRPSLEGVERWRLVIADSRADTVASFDGKDEPPEEIVWDGRTLSGDPMLPGVTCSYVLEAWDKAGNRRNFVGQGFDLPAYRIANEDEMVLMFSADELPSVTSASASLPPVLSDVASWLNQADVTQPIDVRVTASSFDHAKTLAESLVAALRPRVLGDPGRLRALHDVRPDAPEGGTVSVTVGS